MLVNFGDITSKLINDIVNKYLNYSNPQYIFQSIVNIILLVMGILLFYRTIYTFIGFFFKAPKYEKSHQNNKYAIVIAARDEEKVIGNLIDSIKKQTYPQEKITIFVVADNCKDNTAKTCRDQGAIVYERFNDKQISKGFGLQYLFKMIEKDYKILSFDYFLFFDADNLLKKDFVEKINDAFNSGLDVCTSFRNIKNFDTNIISSGYGIHFYRNTLCSHRPRSVLKTSTHVTGTGYGCKAEILKDGWKYTNLTEDAEFSSVCFSQNLKCGYCEEAEIYDEQPIDIKTALKQRLRWRKGALICFKNHSSKLLKNLFKNHSWSSYDLFWQTFPYDLFSFVLLVSVQIFAIIYAFCVTGNFSLNGLFSYFLNFIILTYISSLFIGVLVVIKERKRFYVSFFKLLFYLIMWPFFDIISIVIVVVALFKNVKWTKIKHECSTNIDDMK